MSPNNLLDAPAKRRPLREGKALLDGGAKQLAEITERKWLETALRESEEKYKNLFALLPVGITILDMKGVITACNPAVYNVGGYSEGELVGKHFTKIAPLRLRDIPKYINIFSSIIRGKVPQPFVVEYHRKDGTTGWTEVHVSLLKEGGKKLGVQVIQKDITERKRTMMEALRESEQKFRTSVETLLGGFGIFSAIRDEVGHIVDFRYEYINDSGCQLNQRSREEQIGHTLLELLPAHKDTGLFDEYIRVVETGQPLAKESVLYEDVWGVGQRLARAFDFRAVKLNDGFAVNWRDITERKRVEEMLWESQQLFDKTLVSQHDAVFILDAGNPPVIIDCNPRALEIFGYARQEMLGRATAFLHVDETTLKSFQEYLYPTMAKHGFFHLSEFAMKRRDGTVFPTENSVVSLEDQQGKRIGWVSVVRDITERKRVEEALLLSEEKFRLVTDALPMRVTYVDSEQRYCFSNKACEECFGQPCTEIVGKYVWEVVGESAYQVAQKHIKAALSGQTVTYESTMPYKDGGARHVSVTLVPHFGGKAEIQGFFGLTYDITQRKQAKEMTSAIALGGSLMPLQKEFLKSGFEGFSDRKMIELLLSQSLPYKDCRKLAKECIELFTNLRGLLAASAQELERVGLTSSCMFCIKLLHELPSEVLKESIIEQSVYESSKEVFDYLSYSMRDLKKEVFKVIYLNNRNQIIEVEDLFEGTLESIPIRPREIVESVIEYKAATLIFAHNHPTGDPTPSRSDKQLTRDLVFIGNILQIKVLDHVIIGENTYFSFADDGLIQKYEDNFLNLKMRGGI